MTTIVYRDGILAADRRVTNGDWIMPYEQQKIGRLKSGGLYGISGDVKHRQAAIKFLESLLMEKCPDVKDEARVLYITPTGEAYIIDGDDCRPVGEAPQRQRRYASHRSSIPSQGRRLVLHLDEIFASSNHLD